MSKTYYEGQMTGRIFLASQPTSRSLSGTVICFVSTSLRDSFEQKDPQPSVTRYPAQPTCTVYQPSSVHYRDTFSVKTISLPPQVTGRSYSARHPVVLSTPQGWISTQAIRSSTVKCRRKLPAEGTSMSTVQRAKLPGQGTPTFPSKLPQASPTGYPVFLDTSSYLQRYCQKKADAQKQ